MSKVDTAPPPTAARRGRPPALPARAPGAPGRSGRRARAATRRARVESAAERTRAVAPRKRIDSAAERTRAPEPTAPPNEPKPQAPPNEPELPNRQRRRTNPSRKRSRTNPRHAWTRAQPSRRCPRKTPPRTRTRPDRNRSHALGTCAIPAHERTRRRSQSLARHRAAPPQPGLVLAGEPDVEGRIRVIRTSCGARRPRLAPGPPRSGSRRPRRRRARSCAACARSGPRRGCLPATHGPPTARR